MVAFDERSQRFEADAQDRLERLVPGDEGDSTTSLEVLYRVGLRRYPFIAIIEGAVVIGDAADGEIVRRGAWRFLGCGIRAGEPASPTSTKRLGEVEHQSASHAAGGQPPLSLTGLARGHDLGNPERENPVLGELAHAVEERGVSREVK